MKYLLQLMAVSASVYANEVLELLEEGAVREDEQILANSTDLDSAPAKGLVDLYELYPSEIAEGIQFSEGSKFTFRPKLALEGVYNSVSARGDNADSINTSGDGFTFSRQRVGVCLLYTSPSPRDA